MEQISSNMDSQEQEVQFKIDNSFYQIHIQRLGALWAIFFVLILFLVSANADIEKGIVASYSEFYFSQLSNGRFLIINIILFLILPISLWIANKKSKNKDSNIYFYKDIIKSDNILIPIDDIKKVKIGCCPLNGGLFTYFFVFGIISFMSIPYLFFEFLTFLVMRLLGKSNLNNLSYKFFIIYNIDQKRGVVAGYCFDQETLEKLIELKNKIKVGK